MAGFFDNLLSVFTGDPAKEAADKTRNYLDTTRMSALSDIGSGYNTATGAIGNAASQARGDLTSGYTGAVAPINAGVDQAGGYLRDALARYGGLSDKFGGASTLALNALGVNGAAGTDAARAAFQASPAYSFNLDQGLDAINRRRNAAGMVASGNADRDAQVYGAGLASNEYNTWLNNLMGFLPQETLGVQGGANTLGTLASNELSRGKTLSDLASAYGTNLANLDTSTGRSLADLATGQAGQKVNLATGLAAPYTQTYGQEAAAEQQGSGNFWNLLTNLAGTGANLYGTMNRPSVSLKTT